MIIAMTKEINRNNERNGRTDLSAMDDRKGRKEQKGKTDHNVQTGTKE